MYSPSAMPRGHAKREVAHLARPVRRLAEQPNGAGLGNKTSECKLADVRSAGRLPSPDISFDDWICYRKFYTF
jgi:hypothetical protein